MITTTRIYTGSFSKFIASCRSLLSIPAIPSLAATTIAGIFYTHKLFLVELTMSFHYIKPCDFRGSAIRLI